MEFPFPVPVKEIASWIHARIIGNEFLYLKGINEIHKVQEWDITFVDHPKYYNTSLHSKASAIIVPSEMECPPGKTLLVVEKPFLAYEIIVNRYRPFVALTTEDRVNYEVDPTAIIEPGAIIGQNVRIGKECHIHAGAVIRPYSYLGDRVVIHSGAVIGAPAFYFKKWPEAYQAWTGCGRVIIEDDVWIGAGTTIAQGVSGDTIIGAGTKIDCQVMIGHGVVIGKNCLLAAQVGIAGKTVLGDWCVVYGQAGITQNLNIGDRAIVYAQSGVMKDLEGGHSYFGSPAEETRTKFKEITALKSMAADFMHRNDKPQDEENGK
jgi:UDP-3-O-[3-hydroxymyristoyl] glucosamine N-acyltransferase